MKYKMHTVWARGTKKIYHFECSKTLSHNIVEVYTANKSKVPAFSGSSSYAILNNSIEISHTNEDVSSNAALSKSSPFSPDKFTQFIQILQTIPISDANGKTVRLEPASFVDDLLDATPTISPAAS